MGIEGPILNCGSCLRCMVQSVGCTHVWPYRARLYSLAKARLKSAAARQPIGWRVSCLQRQARYPGGRYEGAVEPWFQRIESGRPPESRRPERSGRKTRKVPHVLYGTPRLERFCSVPPALAHSHTLLSHTLTHSHTLRILSRTSHAWGGVAASPTGCRRGRQRASLQGSPANRPAAF